MTGARSRMIHVAWAVVLVAVVIGRAECSPMAATGAAATPVPGKSVEWVRYDVDLDLRGDGVLHVAEREVVAFHGGPFTGGFATIPLRNLAGIDAVRVSEVTADGTVMPYAEVAGEAPNSTPNTFRVQKGAAEVRVDWWFAPTTDAERTFVLAYDVRGALREGTEDGTPYQEIWWIAIGVEVTTAAPVRAATVTLRLPSPVDPGRVLVSPTGFVPVSPGARSVWTWERTDLAAGEEVVIRLRFPAIVRGAPLATPAA